MHNTEFDILLTGSNGFLGSVIFKFLNKYSINTLNTLSGNYCLDLSKISPQFNKKFDIVIHAAGKAHSIPKTEIEKLQFYNVNVLGTKNLLEGLTNSGIPKCFVFISSVSVYGKDFGIGIDENAPLLALDPYGISKIEGERIVIDWCKKHGVVCSILRLPLIVGSNPPGNLGAMIKGIQMGYYFNIGGGMVKKSMVLAEDVAKSILSVAKVGGIYNFTDGYHPTFDELSHLIALQLNKSKPLNLPLWLAILIAKFGDILGNKAPLNTKRLKKINSELTFDDNKARVAFGWEPTPVLEGFKFK